MLKENTLPLITKGIEMEQKIDKRRLTKNKVPNAQIAAWTAVSPSTIHLLRNGKTLTNYTLIIMAAATGIANSKLITQYNQKNFIPFLEEKYLKAGSPMAMISGRDFTDLNRIEHRGIIDNIRAQVGVI